MELKVLLGLLLVALVSACTSAKPPPASAGGAQPSFRALGASVTPEKASPSDETIGFEVRRRFQMAANDTTAGVIIEIDGGIVTLRGVAPTQTAIMAAGAMAQAVPGVKKVVNLIRLSTPAVY